MARLDYKEYEDIISFLELFNLYDQAEESMKIQVVIIDGARHITTEGSNEFVYPETFLLEHKKLTEFFEKIFFRISNAGSLEDVLISIAMELGTSSAITAPLCKKVYTESNIFNFIKRLEAGNDFLHILSNMSIELKSFVYKEAYHTLYNTLFKSYDDSIQKFLDNWYAEPSNDVYIQQNFTKSVVKNKKMKAFNILLMFYIELANVYYRNR